MKFVYIVINKEKTVDNVYTDFRDALFRAEEIDGFIAPREVIEEAK